MNDKWMTAILIGSPILMQILAVVASYLQRLEYGVGIWGYTWITG